MHFRFPRAGQFIDLVRNLGRIGICVWDMRHASPAPIGVQGRDSVGSRAPTAETRPGPWPPPRSPDRPSPLVEAACGGDYDFQPHKEAPGAVK